MLIDKANPEIVRQVVEQYEALLAIEKTSATKTNKTRNQLIQSLAPAELVAVAVILSEKGYLKNGGTK
jgi:hypothetical protein